MALIYAIIGVKEGQCCTLNEPPGSHKVPPVNSTWNQHILLQYQAKPTSRSISEKQNSREGIKAILCASFPVERIQSELTREQTLANKFQLKTN